jgi:hypothetical protein
MNTSIRYFTFLILIASLATGCEKNGFRIGAEAPKVEKRKFFTTDYSPCDLSPDDYVFYGYGTTSDFKSECCDSGYRSCSGLFDAPPTFRSGVECQYSGTYSPECPTDSTFKSGVECVYPGDGSPECPYDPHYFCYLYPDSPYCGTTTPIEAPIVVPEEGGGGVYVDPIPEVLPEDPASPVTPPPELAKVVAPPATEEPQDIQLPSESGPTPPLEWENRKDDAIATAINFLRAVPSCNYMVSGPAGNALDILNRLDLRNEVVIQWASDGSAAAMVSGAGDPNCYITLYGPFFTKHNADGSFSFTTLAERVVTILHEVRHCTGVEHPIAATADARGNAKFMFAHNVAYTNDIARACGLPYEAF